MAFLAYTSIALLAIASLLSLAASIWFLVVAFRESIGWGLAVLLLSPIAALLFLVLHWSDARRPFLLNLLAALISVGVVAMTYSLAEPETAPVATTEEEVRKDTLVPAIFAQTIETIQRKAEKTNASKRIVLGEYVGRPLAEIVEELGEPPAVLTRGKAVIYVYQHLEIVSTDGVTVSEEIRR